MQLRCLFLSLILLLALAPHLLADGADVVISSDCQDLVENAQPTDDKPTLDANLSQLYFRSTQQHSESAGKLEHWLHCLPEICSQIDRECSLGDRILTSLYGVRRHELPNFIVFLEDHAGPISPFTATDPSLIWRRRSTPYLRGVDHIWVVVFSKRVPAFDLQVELLTLFEKSANPFAGLFGLLKVVPATAAQEPPPAKSVEARITASGWRSLALEGSEEHLFISTARLPVANESVNFLSIVQVPKRGEEVLLTQSLAEDGEVALVVRPKPAVASPEEERTPNEEKEDSAVPQHHLVSGHFSNTSPNRVAFSVGLAGTLNAEATSLKDETHFNGYALAKLYVRRPRIKAFLKEGRVGRRSRPSVGFVAGTSLDDLFEEIVVGVSIGHILGRTGVVLGANRTPRLDDIDRKWRPWVGFDYTF